MVHRVACCAIDNGRVSNILSIVDHDGPDVDEGEECYVCELLEREDKREEMVRDGLSEAVQGVEGMGCERRGHDPLMVRLVQSLVDRGVV